MGNLLKTLMKQAESDAPTHADLLAMRGAWLVSAEFEPFFLGQEIWWKPDPTTPEMGPGTILFRKIDYPLIHKKAVIEDYPIEEAVIVREYGQVVSSVVVEFQGTEWIVIPATITRRGAVPPDRVSQKHDATSNFVSCECDWPAIGPLFNTSEDPWFQPVENCVCYTCGGIISS
jgi:hypothetical protein